MALPLASVAAPAPTTVPAGKVEAPTKATPAPALRAYIDPQTGRLIGHPVTDEQKRAAARSSATPRRNKVLELHHADGSTEYVLNGAADAQIIATVGKDGKIHTHCTDASHQLLPGTTTMQPERRDDR
ncbi:MAG TPA: hypothetical protein VFN13_13585 [Rudaea sp.]|nr:hypothetical protein [Rudaea sp.]